MDYYRFFPAKFREKTLRLDPYQDGCYRRLIDEYMTTRKPLPSDEVALARICGISLQDWNLHACALLLAYFEHCNGMLFQKNCDEELAFQDNATRFKTEKGKKAATIRWNKNKELHASALLGDARVESRESIKKESKKDSPPPPIGKEAPDAKPKRKRMPATFIDDTFQPDIESLTIAGQLNIDPDPTRKEFIDYWKGVGKSMCDWQAAFRNRLRQIAKYRAERAARDSTGRQNVRDVTGAALRVIALRQQNQG